jgi:hypothetical protein
MRAIEKVTGAGILTPDVGGTATTKDVTDAVVEAIQSSNVWWTITDVVTVQVVTVTCAQLTCREPTARGAAQWQAPATSDPNPLACVQGVCRRVFCHEGLLTSDSAIPGGNPWFG